MKERIIPIGDRRKDRIRNTFFFCFCLYKLLKITFGFCSRNGIDDVNDLSVHRVYNVHKSRRRTRTVAAIAGSFGTAQLYTLTFCRPSMMPAISELCMRRKRVLLYSLMGLSVE